MTLEWTGVTVGYQGRYFETRNKPKGGAFADNGFMQEPLAFAVGDKTVIPAIDEAVRGMAPGGIRRIIVPEEIGYPKDGFKTVGPKPSTFSGERALDFVLASRDNMMEVAHVETKARHGPPPAHHGPPRPATARHRPTKARQSPPSLPRPTKCIKARPEGRQADFASSRLPQAAPSSLGHSAACRVCRAGRLGHAGLLFDTGQDAHVRPEAIHGQGEVR